MSKFSDTASIYSTTETLVDLPVLYDDTDRASSSSLSVSDSVSSNGPLPGLHLVLYTTYDGGMPKQDDRMDRAGFPTTAARGYAPNGSLNPLSSLKKRLVTQLPLSEMQRPFNPVPDPEDGQESQKRMDQRPNGRAVGTLFQWQFPEMISIRRRTRMSLALAALYKAPDVKDAYACFPNHRIINSPSSFLDKKTGHAKVPMRYATVSFASPASIVNNDVLESSSGKGKQKDITAQMDAFYETNPLLKATHRETGQEVFDRLKQHIPASQEAENTLTDLLNHLESRGVIWTDAGQDMRPTVSRPDPTSVPKFVVGGLFPAGFIERCTWFYRKDRMPMESDLEHPKGALPLVIRTAHDVADDGGFASGDDHKGSGKGAGVMNGDGGTALGTDFLHGWSAQVTKEPYVTGSLASFMPPGAFVFGGAGGAC